MELKQEYIVDRTGWASGPWDHEPDRVEWRDKDTGLPCLILRNTWLRILCGYVAVPPSHSWYGVAYNACTLQSCKTWCSHTPESLGNVHGRLTFSSFCLENSPTAPGEPGNVFWFGFDCGHAMDLLPGVVDRSGATHHFGEYRNVAYVQAEVTKLAAQLFIAPDLTQHT